MAKKWLDVAPKDVIWDNIDVCLLLMRFMAVLVKL